MQLDLVLKTFFKCCYDHNLCDINVLFKTSSNRFFKQYELLRERYKEVKFIYETNFREQLIEHLSYSAYSLLLVDDVIFTSPFKINDCISGLEIECDAVSVCLLLGQNTNYCYMHDVEQKVPDMYPVISTPLLKYKWTEASHDFGYPLDISGSLYRTYVLLSLIENLSFRNPNTLESALYLNRTRIQDFPWRLVYPKSICFCNPMNMVQDVFVDNRVSKLAMSPEYLADLFDEGFSIDEEGFLNIVSNGAHMEINYDFRRLEHNERISIGQELPYISCVIPVYNGAKWLPYAVKSLTAQRYPHMEVIIVDDGSEDETLSLSHDISRKTRELNVKVLSQRNLGPAAARNLGIKNAIGEWILPLDCDDSFAPNFIHDAVGVILRNPQVNLIFSDLKEFGYKSGTWEPIEYSWENLLRQDTFPYASLFRRYLWELVGGYDPSLPWGPEDWNFWISCSSYGLVPYRLKGHMFYYRTHEVESRYTKMLRHWDEVVSCLFTLHPHKYSISTLLQAHSIICNMCTETLDKIEETIRKFPEFPMPFFWRGLVKEKNGQLLESIVDYTKAAKLSKYNNWQPYFRLYYVYSNLGKKSLALSSAFNAIIRRPALSLLINQTNINKGSVNINL
ncbi:MAG: glycosyltransferase family A protein [candidate division WOR-3 bacterium]